MGIWLTNMGIWLAGVVPIAARPGRAVQAGNARPEVGVWGRDGKRPSRPVQGEQAHVSRDGQTSRVQRPNGSGPGPRLNPGRQPRLIERCEDDPQDVVGFGGAERALGCEDRLAPPAVPGASPGRSVDRLQAVVGTGSAGERRRSRGFECNGENRDERARSELRQGGVAVPCRPMVAARLQVPVHQRVAHGPPVLHVPQHAEHQCACSRLPHRVQPAHFLADARVRRVARRLHALAVNGDGRGAGSLQRATDPGSEGEFAERLPLQTTRDQTGQVGAGREGAVALEAQHVPHPAPVVGDVFAHEVLWRARLLPPVAGHRARQPVQRNAVVPGHHLRDGGAGVGLAAARCHEPGAVGGVLHVVGEGECLGLVVMRRERLAAQHAGQPRRTCAEDDQPLASAAVGAVATELHDILPASRARPRRVRHMQPGHPARSAMRTRGVSALLAPCPGLPPGWTVPPPASRTPRTARARPIWPAAPPPETGSARRCRGGRTSCRRRAGQARRRAGSPASPPPTRSRGTRGTGSGAGGRRGRSLQSAPRPRPAPAGRRSGAAGRWANKSPRRPRLPHAAHHASQFADPEMHAHVEEGTDLVLPHAGRGDERAQRVQHSLRPIVARDRQGSAQLRRDSGSGFGSPPNT